MRGARNRKRKKKQKKEQVTKNTPGLFFQYF
jgi:hypothetical protein